MTSRAFDPTTAALRMLLARTARIIHRVIGAPDYERYVAHVRECHPDQNPMSKVEFERERLEARYSRPGSRCC